MNKNAISTLFVVFIAFIVFATNCNAQAQVDGNIWVSKMNENEKIIYIVGYIDGVSAGVGQGVRFAMNTRLPDTKVFDEAFSIWSGIKNISSLIKKIDSYYKDVEKRSVPVMHAIMSILVEDELSRKGIQD